MISWGSCIFDRACQMWLWMWISQQSPLHSSQKLDFISDLKSNTLAYIYSQLQSTISQYDPVEGCSAVRNTVKWKCLEQTGPKGHLKVLHRGLAWTACVKAVMWNQTNRSPVKGDEITFKGSSLALDSMEMKLLLKNAWHREKNCALL